LRKQKHLSSRDNECIEDDIEDENKIIGRWKLIAQGYYDRDNNYEIVIIPVVNSSQYIEFFLNGYIKRPYFSNGEMIEVEYPYKIDGQFLYENYEDKQNFFIYKYEIDNDKITLDCIEGNIPVIPNPRLITIYQQLKE
jgi:hypothetical protein